jgi:thioredoxin reductase
LLLEASLLLPIFGKSDRKKMKTSKQLDVIIIGGSYSGLAAGMALGRALRNVLVIDGGDPCNKQTPHSHNFLTNDGKTPKEIANLARAQVRSYRCVTLMDGIASNVIKTDKGFKVELESSEVFEAKKLVFATGIKDIFPDIPGLRECWGISVLHCPYCHGFEVRRQKTGILANGDLAFELSSLISNWTDDLTLYTNGKCTLNSEQIAKLGKHNISIIEHRISRLEQKNGSIRQMVFDDGSHAPVTALYARMPFVQHCNLSVTLGCALTPEGYIKIDSAQKSTVPGVYACGDNTTKMRTAANAVSMGTTTGLMVNKELTEEEF